MTRYEKNRSDATHSFSAIMQPYTLNALSNNAILVLELKIMYSPTQIYVKCAILSIYYRDMAEKLSSKTKKTSKSGGRACAVLDNIRHGDVVGSSVVPM